MSNKTVKQEHSEHYWLHEINNARADGYERGYAAGKAETVEQEPVFWVHPMDFGRECGVTPKQESDELIPLYTAPVDAKAIRAEALEEAAKMAEAYVARGIGMEMAAAIRGLK